MENHKKKALYAMMALIIVFGCVFLVALSNMLRGHALFGIGIGQEIENGLTMVLSLIAIIRLLFEMHNIEKA